MRAALFCALLGALGIARADIGVNIFGASYHFERDKAKELGLTNDVNPGLGLRWRESFDVFADVGVYRGDDRLSPLAFPDLVVTPAGLLGS